MNRPSNKGLCYNTDIDGYAFDDYIENLEKYCDELEVVNKELTYVNGSELAQMYKEFFWEYQKALDKACEIIETYDTKGNYAKLGWTKEEWKEWLLKDE